MDGTPLRKLALTLKPLIEIADTLDKISAAEGVLATIQGKTVAAKRELDLVIANAEKTKHDAEAAANKTIDSAKINADGIVKQAQENADANARMILDAVEKRVADLKRREDRLISSVTELEAKGKALAEKAEESRKQADAAEKQLAIIRSKLEAIRI